MASQDGQLGGPAAHSGADTALSGADSFNQDGGVAVESPFATDSQASVALAGEHSLPRAAGSTVHTSAHLLGNDIALSVTNFKGALVAPVSSFSTASTDASRAVQATEGTLKVLSVLRIHRLSTLRTIVE